MPSPSDATRAEAASHDELIARLDAAERALARLTDGGMQAILANAIDRITPKDFDGYPRGVSAYTAANAALVAIRQVARTEETP